MVESEPHPSAPTITTVKSKLSVQSQTAITFVDKKPFRFLSRIGTIGIWHPSIHPNAPWKCLSVGKVVRFGISLCWTTYIGHSSLKISSATCRLRAIFYKLHVDLPVLIQSRNIASWTSKVSSRVVGIILVSISQSRANWAALIRSIVLHRWGLVDKVIRCTKSAGLSASSSSVNHGQDWRYLSGNACILAATTMTPMVETMATAIILCLLLLSISNAIPSKKEISNKEKIIIYMPRVLRNRFQIDLRIIRPSLSLSRKPDWKPFRNRLRTDTSRITSRSVPKSAIVSRQKTYNYIFVSTQWIGKGALGTRILTGGYFPVI